MIGGGEKVTFSAHLDKVRLQVRDTDGHLVVSVLRDLPEAFDIHAQLNDAMLTAREHEEAQA